MKNNVFLAIFFLFLFIGCKTNANKHTVKHKQETTNVSNTPSEERFLTIDISDGDGHGPGTNSLEGLGAMAHQLIYKRQQLNKKQNDFVLLVFDVEKVRASPKSDNKEPPLNVKCVYRFLSDTIFKMIEMEAKGNQARLIPNSKKIIGKREVLAYILEEKLAEYKSDSKIKIDDMTKINHVLQTEHQMEEVYYPLNYLFNFNDISLTQFKNTFNQNKSFGKWVSLLQIDLTLKN